MMSGLGPLDHVRLKWMTTLQATGGLALEEMVDAARTSPSEIDRLFDCLIDTYSPGESETTRPPSKPHLLPLSSQMG
jgi:hypothetical protein